MTTHADCERRLRQVADLAILLAEELRDRTNGAIPACRSCGQPSPNGDPCETCATPAAPVAA